MRGVRRASALETTRAVASWDWLRDLVGIDVLGLVIDGKTEYY
jgi:hypothetical protein